MKTPKEKPYCGNRWTKARFKSFIMSALRRAQWPVKYDCIKSAFVEEGINTETGHRCKLHQCKECHSRVPANKMHADHINPVHSIDGAYSSSTDFLDVNWNDVIRNLYCEIGGFQPICKKCHKAKSKEENAKRRANKKQ